MSYNQGYNYQGQPNQYGTSATGVPQQQRQPMPQAPLSSTTPQVLVSSSRDYPQQQTYPSSSYPQTQASYPQTQAQPGYPDPAYGYPAAAQGNPSFPLPIPPPPGGSVQRGHQRGHSGQSETLYAPAGGSISIQRSPSGQSATLYAPAGGSVQRSPSGQSATLYAPSGGSMQRSPSGQSANLYPTSSSVQRGYSGQSGAHQYPPAQTYDSTSSSYPGSQSTSHHLVPHGHGTNASDSYRSGSSYQTAVPAVARVTVEPQYGGTQGGISYSQPQRPDAYGYADNEGHMNENRPKSPGRGPVQGRQYNCRLPGCNQPMFYDRRFNEFWEWCSTHHIQTGLGRGLEKVCKNCRVWPRKYSYKYCGGPSCNKAGLPLSSH